MPENPIIVIPARMSATRLPGKPLASLNGEPMIVHVWRRAKQSDTGTVIVACGEQEIYRAVIDAGGRAVLTDPDLPSGSDRVREAVDRIDPQRRHDVVINLQGDLPFIDPGVLKAVLKPLACPEVSISTAVAEIRDEGERADPNVVKAVISLQGEGRMGRALYFSRSLVPSAPEGPHYHHIGIYGFRREALEAFVRLPPSPLEKQERLEQLRALEAGMRIDAVLVDTVPLGVDTPADLDRARQMLATGSF